MKKKVILYLAGIQRKYAESLIDSLGDIIIGYISIDRIAISSTSFPVIDIRNICKYKFDYILTSDRFAQKLFLEIKGLSIKEKLYQKIAFLPECKHYGMNMLISSQSFNMLHFEISGTCNANCQFCQTGIKNKCGLIDNNDCFIDLKKFSTSLEYMIRKKIISSKSIVCLYNWGEPYLHPELGGIINILNKLNLKIGISTNASCLNLLDEVTDFGNISFIAFSLSGFTQSSYDKIHGFNLEKIKSNIEAIVANYRKRGYKGKFQISFHVYKFNINEIKDAKNWADKNKIDFIPYYAYINDFERFIAYRNNVLIEQERRNIYENIFVEYIDNIIDNSKYYNTEVCMGLQSCKAHGILTIDHECNVLMCCGENSILKKITEIRNVNEIINWRKESDICKNCINLGINSFGLLPKHYMSN